MKEINYYVIGGQYAAYCHGGTKTLLGANDWPTNARSTGTTGKAGIFPPSTAPRTPEKCLIFTVR